METETLDALTQLTRMTCGTCGVPFAMPTTMVETLKKESGGFYCPNGHNRGWWESDADRLRKEKIRLQAELDQSRAAAADELKRRIEAERESERLKARTKAGVCTCCNRTFQNLKLHMETKHGDKPASKGTKKKIERYKNRQST